MNQVLWNMRAAAVTIPGQAEPAASGRGGGRAVVARPGGGTGLSDLRRHRARRGGEYTVIVTAGGKP